MPVRRQSIVAPCKYQITVQELYDMTTLTVRQTRILCQSRLSKHIVTLFNNNNNISNNKLIIRFVEATKVLRVRAHIVLFSTNIAMKFRLV